MSTHETNDSERWSQALAELLDPARTLRLLRHACGRSGWELRAIRAAEVVKEWPERRRTIRYSVVARRPGEPEREIHLYGKQYRGSKGARVRRLMEILRSTTPPDVEVAEPLGYSPKFRLLVVPALEGPTLQERLENQTESELQSKLERVGRAVATVHESPLAAYGDSLTSHGPSDEAAVLEKACRRAGAAAWPEEVTARFEQACAVVRDELTTGWPGPDRQSLIHRDLHPGQVVVNGGGVGFLDWDAAAWGEPELDLGNLAAHIMLDDLQRRGRVSVAPERVEALRTGYRASRGIDEARFGAYTSSALLRLATLERLADPGVSLIAWPEMAAALVDEALRFV